MPIRPVALKSISVSRPATSAFGERQRGWPEIVVKTPWRTSRPGPHPDVVVVALAAMLVFGFSAASAVGGV